jgi:hypothetical protein
MAQKKEHGIEFWDAQTGAYYIKLFWGRFTHSSFFQLKKMQNYVWHLYK